MATKKDPNKYLRCMSCDNEKIKETSFYNTKNKLYEKIGKLPICKACLKSTVNYDDMESIYSILRQFDIMFDVTHWESAENSKTDTFATYMRMANSLSNFDGKGWKHSTFNNTPSSSNTKITDSQELSQDEVNENIDIEHLEYLKEKYGYGYPDDEYFLFEKKFNQLKPSFQLVTTMHEECLREYCVNKVKETLAKARGDFKEAKDWAAMAKDTAEAGKLKPSQMSKADLSQGLDGFGQLARMVEEKVDIIPVLPKFTSQPKDKPDIVLWCYINYVRDLKGLAEADYKDIYEFYEIRRKDYEKQELDSDPSMREE
ncbi:hypothetical protein NSS71_08685 [Niallia sp. FSL W8-0951]|uniref:hypothetical protein n=1 Tax=Niallia TaxID=2837506 RepID=UPI0026EE63A8|nr:hypothetical protein [Niallia circulans]